MIKIRKYKVGTKMIHPLHGAGEIECIEKRKVLNREEECYVVKFLLGNLRMVVPIRAMKSTKLRKIPKGEIEKIIEFLQANEPEEEAIKSDWRIRYMSYLEEVKIGSIYKTINVIKRLKRRSKKGKKLTPSEKHLLENTCNIIASEIASVRNISFNEAISLVKKLIQLEEERS